MAETLTPDPKQQRPPMASRLQSPTSPFFLGSNDDKLERAQARAARAAASRRKSVTVGAVAGVGVGVVPPDPCFSRSQIVELFQNCIKLASENKINQKNTWELGLIDHLSEIIKVEAEDDVETNFQKASCTLEAGVKIYALRVDSVYTEAYKVLGGINRAGREDEQEATVEDGNSETVKDDGRAKKDADKKISPLSTLDSFEALNVKKFDVAFAVDPLYHQMTAQFDEGGAKGLLLNNLGVYGGCRVVFDSLETPGKFVSRETRSDESATVDISFARECVEQMATSMTTKDEISPSLSYIINQFDEDNQRPSNISLTEQKASGQVDAAAENNGVDSDREVFDHYDGWGVDHDDHSSVVDESLANNEFVPNHEEVFTFSILISLDVCFIIPFALRRRGKRRVKVDYYITLAIDSVLSQENASYTFHEPDMEDSHENVIDFLFFGMGFTSNRNAWAGPDHWKFQKAKGGEENPIKENGSPCTTRKKNKKQAEPDIEFTKSLEKEMPDIFAPPKNPKSLLLPANRVACKTTLPEDCHYQPQNLVKLFLLPNIVCLGKRQMKPIDESRCEDFDEAPSWDNGSVFGGQFVDDNGHSDVEDMTSLVSQPRQVNKIEVQYDKTAKQVDVHVLKGTLWNHMQESVRVHEQEKGVSFREVLTSFPIDCQAAAPEDISPHLCFICLLHLANEHSLSILGSPSLDDLRIQFPTLLKSTR
ncbi:hypothetical protein Scep_028815 [Stephania cephalantha]|uniref:Condensin complex subunit 2 n=1 Tax=Stephania cephalantha TaxID=152367 RepID=A0AAP0EEW3_9MAGN